MSGDENTNTANTPVEGSRESVAGSGDAASRQTNVQPASGAVGDPPQDRQTQTQTQSMQQPPDTLNQGAAAQPQTRAGQRVQQQTDDPGIPAAASLGPLTEAVYVPLPTGGIPALAAQLYPDDKENAEAMSLHVSDLLMMNRDTVLNEHSATVGTTVRIK